MARRRINSSNNIRYAPYQEGPAGIRSFAQPRRQTQAAEPVYTKMPVDSSGAGLGTLSYDPQAAAGYSASSMAPIGDPDAYYATVAQNQYETSIQEFQPFEQALIDTLEDTSIVDSVRGDVETQSRIAKEVAERNRQRYGYDQTAAERSEVSRAQQRGQATNLAGGLNTARLAQRERNKNLMADLINIGLNQQRSSMYQLGVSAQNAVDRRNAYTQAQAQAKSQRFGMIGNFLGNVPSFI